LNRVKGLGIEDRRGHPHAALADHRHADEVDRIKAEELVCFASADFATDPQIEGAIGVKGGQGLLGAAAGLPVDHANAERPRDIAGFGATNPNFGEDADEISFS
jgi:hypothetical protein